MNPRGFWGTFIMIGALTALPFALLWSLLFSLMMGMDFGQVLQRGIWGGIGFGLLFGFIMAFFIKALTISIPIKEKGSFVTRLNVILSEMGYHPKSQFGDFLTYTPSFQAGLLAGKISIQIEENSARIVGPSMYITKLQRRMQQCLQF